ncbi:MAG: phosphate butyryltransferase [Prevotellaceae bacterium]|jgi:phosphate butyryltransferase|nr:phosphate butyryltransferase [Prevotellaceae bacterium]
MITSFEEIYAKVASLPKKRLIAAWAVDDHTIGAANESVTQGLVDATLVGDRTLIEKVCNEHQIDISLFRVVHISDEAQAVGISIELIHAGEGDMLMKGLCSTDKYMRGILNKEKGLLPPKAVLSHVSIIAHPGYHKLLLVSDIAVIPAPDLTQKIAIAGYLTSVGRKLGIEKPKIAVLAGTEQMLPAMQACVDGAILSKMADRSQIKNCILDGPMSLDTAISKESAAIKKLKSEVAGDADCLLFPNIEAGNVFYKTIGQFSPNARIAAVVAGAKVPCVLSSRSDSTDTKLNSIIFAALMAER